MEFSLGKQLLVIILLIFGNGIFSLLEMAIVSSHQSRLEAIADEGSKSAAIVLKLRENPNKMFSTVQFGITLISLLTGVYGGTEMAGPLSVYVAKIPGLEPYAYTISLTSVVVLITYLTIILGEIVPKRIAIDNPEKSSLFAGPSHAVLFGHLYACRLDPFVVDDGCYQNDGRQEAGSAAGYGRRNKIALRAGRRTRGF